MSSIAITSGGKFTFPLDPDVATGGIQINALPSPALLAALLKPDGVLPSEDTVVAGTDLSIASAPNITIGPAKVGFSADVNAALGIFTTPGALRTALMKNADLVSQIGDGLDFPIPAGNSLLMLRWGYDISGTAAGSIALGPAASITPSITADTKGYFAIVQGTAPDANARQSLARLVTTWRLPSQVSDLSKLPPATWLIAEVDGSFGVKADLKFGYDFSWVREVAGLGLKGDIGLKLQAGLDAVFGFQASGKYAVALSRESTSDTDQSVRLQLFKLRVRGWNVGLSGSATVTPVSPLPAQYQDLASAITGTTGQQIVKLLRDIKDWTDPSKPIFGPFVNLIDNEARALIQNLTGVTDLNAAFDSVKGRIQQVFQFWDNLPQTATRLIWSLLPAQSEIGRVSSIASQVAGMTPDSLLTFIKTSLADVPFLNSTEGQALESMAVNGLFSALNNAGALKDLQSAAENVSQLLDGSALQSFLTKLQSQVNDRLDLKQIESVVDSATLDSVDAWLKARLENFLEQKLVGPAGVAAIQKLRASLAAIQSKAADLYAAAVKALSQTYDLSFNATYESTTTSTALLDAVFDFAASDSQAAQGLALALGGQFDRLLATPLAGVRIQDGVLAYGIQRRSHVALSLPFVSTSSEAVNDSLAKLTRIDQDGGSLVYSLEASDMVTVKNDFSSALAISLNIPAAVPDVLIHSTGTAAYRYDFKSVAASLTPADLVSRYGPYVSAYFPTEFQPASPGTFDEWIAQIAGAAGQLSAAQVALNVSLPPASVQAWLNAPSSKSDPAYQQMALRLQTRFKQLLHDYFFSNVRNYANVSGDTTAKAVLAFCSVPPVPDAGYWDYRDPDLRSSTLGSAGTVANLRALLQTARLRITAAGDPDRVIAFYQDDQLGPILGAVIKGILIDFLFPVEAIVVDQARAAGLKMAAFHADQFADPAQARRDLAQFGQKLTATFNQQLKTFAVGDALLPLGTLIYTEAAAALDPSATATATAMLSVQTADRSERVVHGK